MKKGKVTVTVGDYIVSLEKWNRIDKLILEIVDIIESCPVRGKMKKEVEQQR